MRILKFYQEEVVTLIKHEIFSQINYMEKYSGERGELTIKS